MNSRSNTDDQKDAKRVILLAAAINVFSKRGFHEAKMQDIADAADVGKGTIYEYFKTKDDLFLAVYDAWMDEYEHEMTRVSDKALTPVDKADALIETTIDFYERHAEHASILLEFWAHALRANDAHFLSRIRQMKERLSELGGSVTKQLIKLKAFTEVDVPSFTRLELGISDGIFLQWVLDGKSYPLREAYKFRQSVIGSGLMTTPFRKVMSLKTNKHLKEGFLTPPPKKKK
jgi:AcrR family transcriptional regulator